MLKENPVRKQRGFMEKIARHESSTLLRESRSRDFQRLLLKRGANVSNLREVSASFSIPFGKEPFDFIKEIAEIREKLGRPVRILSIGEGKSTFLSELIEHFGNKIEAHAVDVIRKNYAEGINGYVAHAEKLPARVHL
ncbi:hypothetical protein HZC09_04160 [Candidatus Micrarchaeota archaeon]|nr:hypothetical protein [Candidatus Micrarchaeota archaeon]